VRHFRVPAPYDSVNVLPRLCIGARCRNDPAPGKALCVGCQRKAEARQPRPLLPPHPTQQPPDELHNRHVAGKRCYVYAVESMPTGAIKIGRALNVRHRLKSLQVSTPDELRERGRIRGTHELEERLHLALAEHNIRGEWFRPAPEVLRVVEMIENKDARGLWLFAADRLLPENPPKAHVSK